ncbi:unnamed protein product [Brassica oleracea]
MTIEIKLKSSEAMGMEETAWPSWSSQLLPREHMYDYWC